MTKRLIGLGTTPNDKTGDSLRIAGEKTNSNFNELYSALGTGTELTVAMVAKTGSYNDLSDTPTIPTDVSDLTDTESLLGGGSGSSDRLINGEYEVVLDANGHLIAPEDIIVGGVDGGRLIIDCTENANTSVRWINMPIDEDASIIRAYTGDPSQETDLNRVRIQLTWQDSNRSGLRIISYDRTDEDNSITHDWTFQGDGILRLPEGGTIVEGVVTDNPTIELMPSNYDVESQKLVIKGGVPPEELDNYHLHLTTGDLTETSIFLGTDDHNVRTTTDGKIQITTLGGNTNVWEFGTDGSLTFPNQSGKINPGVSDGGGLQIEAEYDFEIKVTQFEDEPTIWSFAGNDITFPDNTIQTTAWGGGRIVSTPSTIIGQDGDRQGDMAFDAAYMYYCVANYGGTITSLSWSNASNYPGYVQATIAVPQLLDTGTLQITNNAVNGVTGITVQVDSYELVSGNTYKLYITEPGWEASYQNSELQVLSGSDIWRRVAWSNDTW